MQFQTRIIQNDRVKCISACLSKMKAKTARKRPAINNCQKDWLNTEECQRPNLYSTAPRPHNTGAIKARDKPNSTSLLSSSITPGLKNKRIPLTLSSMPNNWVREGLRPTTKKLKTVTHKGIV